MTDEIETKIEYLGQPGVIGEVTYDALKKRAAKFEEALRKISEGDEYLKMGWAINIARDALGEEK